MATYYVSKSGNDGNAGTSEALAWLTVTKAFQTLQAGDTCYIAPGTYREKPVMSNAGTDGNIILIQGDPDCEHFTNEHKGIVRITGCDADDMPVSGLVVRCEKDYVTLKNFLVDGYNDSSLITRDIGNEQVCENIVVIGGQGCFINGDLINCMMFGSYYGSSYGTQTNCLAMGGYYDFYQGTQTNCLAMGGYYGFYQGTQTNCLAMGGCYGVYQGTQTNCLAMGGYYGYDQGTPTNCLAITCQRGYNKGVLTNCKYSMCFLPSYGASGDAPTEAPIMLWTLSTYQKIIEAFKPWMFEGAKQWGTTSGITVPDTDILGLPRQMIGGGLDIGPYAYSIEEADWSTYSTDAPSIKISQKGAKVFKLPAEVGTAITITCKCKHQNTTGDKPQLLLRGDSISTQTDTCIDTTDTWDTLTVTATPTKDDELEVVCYARDTTTVAVAYFSDIEVS